MAASLKSYLNPQRLRDLVRRGIDPHELPLWTEKLIYSSVIEKISPVIGYRRKAKEKAALIKETIDNAVLQSQTTNIPVVLRNFLEELAPPVKSFVKDEIKPLPIQFPYRQVENLFPKASSGKGKRRKLIEPLQTDAETNSDWFHDYGTPDPTIPASNVSCGGCGAFLHCQDSAIPGYIPSERMKRMDAEDLRTELCQRCYFLDHLNIAVKVNVSPSDYHRLLEEIKDKKALIIVVVDVLDFPCSLWPGIIDIIGRARPVILLGNKVDLLPRDSRNYLEHVKSSLESMAINTVLKGVKLIHTALISATTGYGIEELIDKVFSEWGFKGDIYLLGCTNVGKSSLFNAFLQSDLCKVQAIDLIQRATISPWPGTTLNLLKFPVTRPENWRISMRKKRLREDRIALNEIRQLREIELRETRNPVHATLIGHIGRTFMDRGKIDSMDHLSQSSDLFHVNPFAKHTSQLAPKPGEWNPADIQFANSKWCFDTPGAVAENQILDQFTLEELMLIIPKTVITPRTLLLHPGLTIFVGGIARLDYLKGQYPIRTVVFTSDSLQLNVVRTQHAEEVYAEAFGGPFFGIPFGDENRLKQFPPLLGKVFTVTGIGREFCCADIVISSTGWIGLNIPNNHEAEFEAWTPNGKGIFCRQPSFLPYISSLKGRKLRGSLNYTRPLPYIRK